jgi:hypothetical protein
MEVAAEYVERMRRAAFPDAWTDCVLIDGVEIDTFRFDEIFTTREKGGIRELIFKIRRMAVYGSYRASVIIRRSSPVTASLRIAIVAEEMMTYQALVKLVEDVKTHAHSHHVHELARVSFTDVCISQAPTIARKEQSAPDRIGAYLASVARVRSLDAEHDFPDNGLSTPFRVDLVPEMPDVSPEEVFQGHGGRFGGGGASGQYEVPAERPAEETSDASERFHHLSHGCANDTPAEAFGHGSGTDSGHSYEPCSPEPSHESGGSSSDSYDSGGYDSGGGSFE